MDQGNLFVPVKNTRKTRINLQTVKLIHREMHILSGNKIDCQEIKNYPC